MGNSSKKPFFDSLTVKEKLGATTAEYKLPELKFEDIDKIQTHDRIVRQLSNESSFDVDPLLKATQQLTAASEPDVQAPTFETRINWFINSVRRHLALKIDTRLDEIVQTLSDSKISPEIRGVTLAKFASFVLLNPEYFDAFRYQYNVYTMHEFECVMKQ